MTSDAPLRLGLVVASIRGDRVGGSVAAWVQQAIVAHGGVSLDVLDLCEIDLPDDVLLQPGGVGQPTAVSSRVRACDGYVVVTPEYNRSYPASLKRMIDWHFGEWQFKAATCVSYGARGGLLAAEHLRGVLSELSVVTARRSVGIVAPWDLLDEGRFTPPEGTEHALADALGELTWWAGILRRARTEHPYRSGRSA